MIDINFHFLIEGSKEAEIHSDVEIIFILDGHSKITIDEKEYDFQKEDFVVINSNQKYFLKAETQNFLAGSLVFSYSGLVEMLKKERIVFFCNSVLEENELTGELRAILKKIVYEHGVQEENSEIYLNSLYYKVLYILSTDFLLSKEDILTYTEEHRFDERKYQIMEYVQQNYNKEISLSDLAQKLFLSTTYLSKHIKAQFGMNFIDYVNSVRLSHAVSQIMNSDKPLVKISMETGFATPVALNKVFKEKYHMNPAAYRREWKNKTNREAAHREDREKVKKRVTEFFDLPQSRQFSERVINKKEMKLESISRTPYRNIWTQMINAGTAADLLHSDVQQHILYLKRKLQFRYVRFWDLYSEEIFMNAAFEKDVYNFDKLDRVLDFLLKNDLIPYIELRRKPKKINQNGKDIIQPPKESRNPDLALVEDFMKKLMLHLLGRYTTAEVEKWFFEVWRMEPELYQEAFGEGNVLEPISSYLAVFDTIAGTLRRYLPHIQIGGCGIALRWGEEEFIKLLQEWKVRRNLPDFITVYSYPYGADAMLNDRNQSRDVSFIRKNLERIREIIDAADFPVRRIHVTEWSFSVSSRNVLNDHCMKGAYLVKCMIDSIDLVELMGYWVGTDLFSNYYDTQGILIGGGGLLTKDGIPKPAYFAFEFMKHLGKYLIYKDEHYLITDNGKGNYRIVCHNLKNLGYQYSLMKENEYDVKSINNLFTDCRKLLLTFHLPAEKDGKYILRIQSVNQKNGSIQDSAAEMEPGQDLNYKELSYLERITTPKLLHEHCEAENGNLTFSTSLEPNEIQFIHVTRIYN